MFRLDVFNNSFEYVSAVMIDDHQSIDLDYLTYSPYTVRCKEIEAQKGFFTHITDEDNNTIAEGIIADIKPEQKTQTITIRPLNALFDADVFYTPVSDAISWLASNIQQAFMTNSDTYQNRPINLTYTVASEQLPLTGFNLRETVNILSVMISALKTYGVVVESTLDLVNKRIRVNIFRQEATKTILADLENLISSQVTIGDPFGSTNKATLRKIQVNDDESTTVLGDFNFYLHPDGSIDQSNTNRIQPVFWEMETLQLEDDMTDAQWLAAATARAKEILEPAKFDNEIILRYQQADKLVYPLELPIGAQCEIHLKGEIYASLLTGKALEGKTVTLYFGVVRTDLTKQLSITNRETFSFESTVNAVMKSVAEKYPSKENLNKYLWHQNGNGTGLYFRNSNDAIGFDSWITGAGNFRMDTWSNGSRIAGSNRYGLFMPSDTGGQWDKTPPLGRYKEVSNGSTASLWVRLCRVHLRSYRQGQFVCFRIFIGYGNNGTISQNAMIDLLMQQGWTGSYGGRFGCNYILYPLSTSITSQTIKVLCIDTNLTYDVWIKTAASYEAHEYFAFFDAKYAWIEETTNTQEAEPTNGTACNIQGGRIAYTTF